MFIRQILRICLSLCLFSKYNISYFMHLMDQLVAIHAFISELHHAKTGYFLKILVIINEALKRGGLFHLRSGGGSI